MMLMGEFNGIGKALHSLTSCMAVEIDQEYILIKLLEDSEVQMIVDAVMQIAWVLMAVAIAIFGFQLIAGTQVFKLEIFINLMFAIGIFLALPWLLIQLNTLTDEMYTYGQDIGTSEIEPSSLATQIVQQNT